MKKKIPVLLILLVLLISCDQAKKDFEIASKEGTVQSLNSFVTKQPESEFVKEAKQKIDELDYNSAVSLGTIAAFQEYLSNHENGKFINDAKSKISELNKQNNKLRKSFSSDLTKFGKRNDAVIVIFKANGSVNRAADNIKKLMHTFDQNSFMNPYWIVNFFKVVTDSNTQCGYIIGEWYQYNYPYRGTWEGIVFDRLSDYASEFAVGYGVDGSFRVVASHEANLPSLRDECYLDFR